MRSHLGSGTDAERAQLDSAMGNLLQALGRALESDEESVPVYVREAALRVARQVQASRQEQVTGRRQDRRGWHHVQADTGWGAVRGEALPFATSIRLGRMG